MDKSLTRQNSAGWLMAGPAFLLICLFLILPFLMAIGFSFTNQRPCISESDRMGGNAEL